MWNKLLKRPGSRQSDRSSNNNNNDTSNGRTSSGRSRPTLSSRSAELPQSTFDDTSQSDYTASDSAGRNRVKAFSSSSFGSGFGTRGKANVNSNASSANVAGRGG